jgi:hydroxyacylglutathione hydrolase
LQTRLIERFGAANEQGESVKSLEYIPLPFFEDNYAWLITDGTHVIVVDPGEAAPVIRYCEARQLRLSGVLLTHHHTDHTGGVANLLDSSSNHAVPVFGPATEPIFGVTTRVGDGYRVELAEPHFSATVIGVPGHTDGHIAFFRSAVADNPPHLFSGDTLFASGCGRLLEGTAEQMLCSLDILADLPSSTLVHCAHEYTLSNIRFSMACEPGNRNIARWCETATALRLAGEPTIPTTIEHEQAVNPFLRVLIETFKVPVPHRLAAFILLRAWKDLFSEDAVPNGNHWVPAFQQA